MKKLPLLTGIALCAFSVSAQAFETLAKNALLMDADTGYVYPDASGFNEQINDGIYDF